METGRSGSLMSQGRAGSGLFSPFAFAAENSQPGRRDTQQSGQPRQSSSRHGSIRKSGAAGSTGVGGQAAWVDWLLPLAICCLTRPCPPPALHDAAGRFGSISSRYSRGSVSRGTKGGAAPSIDSAGLPFERILCIDEEGRDRTPKPLLAPGRGHGTAPGWGGDGPGGSDGSSSEHASAGGFRLSIPSARSWLASEATEVSLDGAGLPPGVRPAGRESTMHGSGGGRESVLHGRESVLHGRESALHGAGRESVQYGAGGAASIRGSLVPGGEAQEAAAGIGGDAWPLAGATLDGDRAGEAQQQPAIPELLALQHGQQLHHRQGQPQERGSQPRVRSKATQCAAVTRASRGIQVMPWELRAAAAKSPDGDGGEEDAAALAARQGGAGDGAEAAGGADGGEDEEAALLALQSFGPGTGGGGLDTRRGSPVPSHRGGGGLHSQSSSRRGSMAGGWLQAGPDVAAHTASSPLLDLHHRLLSCPSSICGLPVQAGQHAPCPCRLPPHVDDERRGRVEPAGHQHGRVAPHLHAGLRVVCPRLNDEQPHQLCSLPVGRWAHQCDDGRQGHRAGQRGGVLRWRRRRRYC